MISTKARYALRVMIDLAEHQDAGYIPLKDIAARQEISEKYLEIIIKILVKGKMLKGLRGKGGERYEDRRIPAAERGGDPQCRAGRSAVRPPEAVHRQCVARNADAAGGLPQPAGDARRRRLGAAEYFSAEYAGNIRSFITDSN